MMGSFQTNRIQAEIVDKESQSIKSYPRPMSYIVAGNWAVVKMKLNMYYPSSHNYGSGKWLYLQY